MTGEPPPEIIPLALVPFILKQDRTSQVVESLLQPYAGEVLSPVLVEEIVRRAYRAGLEDGTGRKRVAETKKEA